ncbi:hypothetical protein AU197_06445 [Mycobacterium sp. IS-1590]|uniref:DUF6197 family protein n=1 Tax=Mycobacterium sp. IS-1590 TaxID=1772286 RepID=UPI000746864A|nr:hypothetical protein [Mycobacterium sp. IS-1590]KUI42144.1 hypothetical protein AU197_06445 [Mycobacterium sp. IS-1590]
MTTISRLTAQTTPPKTDREVIEEALGLIEAENGWTQGTYCRDAEGAELRADADSPGEWVRVRAEHVGRGGYVVRTEPAASPCSYCLGGALRAASGYWHATQSYAALEQVERLECLVLRLANSVAARAWPSLQAYNDDAYTTRADAVLILKRAAAHLDAQEQK